MAKSIASRVLVFAHDRYAFSVDPARCRRMLQARQAQRRCSGRIIRALDLYNPPIPPHEARNNPRWHGGSSLITTRIEQLHEGDDIIARLIQHKRWSRSDSDADLFIRRIFRASILENLCTC